MKNKILSFSLPEFKEARHNAAKKISISGVQPKYSLRKIKGKLQLTDKNGEYILKPIYNNDFDFSTEMPANEHVTMQIAKRVFGLNTAKNELVFFSDKTPAYLTKRFDVLPKGERLRVEDFAQLAGLSGENKDSGYKYNFSYQQMAQILKTVVGKKNYIANAENLFKVVVFNYLVCNGDAHIKNFSIIFPKLEPPTFAPFYDLMNTRLHLPSDNFMALDLFEDGYFTPVFEKLGFFSYKDFSLFGEKIGLDKQKTDDFLTSIPKKIPKINKLLEYSNLTKAAIGKYKIYMEDRAKMLCV